ncbi:MAG: TonB-dependent receptor plug domain-containing protein [Bacteroidota bacterium]|nr:TonB-dependent receptor plug domain-containing protein [Bacteroidota bacterium]
MKKTSIILFIFLANCTLAQTDTSQVLDEVNVNAVRAKTNPSNTLVGKKEIDANNTGRDLPYLLNRTPSTVVTSDAGNGFGYTGIRIRGVDATRINVTVNGVPLNDAESHGMYWVDLPDFASGTNNIQVQRGVGSSTNGNAAFGASINLKTLEQSDKAYTNFATSFGYIMPEKTGFVGTKHNRFSQKYNINFGTGKINNWTVDARLSMINSDGYVLRSKADLKSYYIQTVYNNKNTLVKLIHFSGKEVTGQAWNGVPETVLKGDSATPPNRIYNEFTYKNQTDNYKQDYYQAFYTKKLSKFIFNTAVHYTKGYGYYEEYKTAAPLALYGIVADSGKTANSDLIRRRWLDNGYFGLMANAQFKNLILGLHVSQYTGKNYGEVIWARYAGNSENSQKYYNGKSTKNEVNVFAKYYNKFSNKLTYFVDVQYRYIDYSLKGNDDVWGYLVEYKHHLNYNFFNPKAALNYELNNANKLNIYYGISNREPVRSDIILSSDSLLPKPEMMQDIEFGWNFHKSKLTVNTNMYYMYYKNQLVNDGSVNDVGQYNRINVPVSYRAGIELEANYKANEKFTLYGNITFSQNKIKNYSEFLDFYDSSNTWVENKLNKIYKSVDIAFSPSITGFAQIKYVPAKDFQIGLSGKYISRQYLDNTQNKLQSIDLSVVFDLQINYTVRTKICKQIDISVLVNNITNALYTTNGYSSAKIVTGQRVLDNKYYPNAVTNFLMQLRFSL